MDPDSRTPWDTADVVDAFRTTWALFTAIEAQDHDRINDILTATDDWVLMHGWDCVAGRLLDVLRRHAQVVGATAGVASGSSPSAYTSALSRTPDVCANAL